MNINNAYSMDESYCGIRYKGFLLRVVAGAQLGAKWTLQGMVGFLWRALILTAMFCSQLVQQQVTESLSSAMIHSSSLAGARGWVMLVWTLVFKACLELANGHTLTYVDFIIML